jgi:hypothetical protein
MVDCELASWAVASHPVNLIFPTTDRPLASRSTTTHTPKTINDVIVHISET